jgi:hypothetical protein
VPVSLLAHMTYFATAFTQQSLLDAAIVNWLFIALYYSNGFIAATFFGGQTRIMAGSLARANFMLIVSLWALFKFTLIPIGAQLQTLYAPGQFVVLFSLIWGTYLIVDTLAEVGGSLYGNQKIPVRGIGPSSCFRRAARMTSPWPPATPSSAGHSVRG